jgi:hypothetical protein
MPSRPTMVARGRKVVVTVGLALLAVSVRGVLSVSTTTVTRFRDRCDLLVPESEFGPGGTASVPCDPERVTAAASWRWTVMTVVVVVIVLGAALLWLLMPRLVPGTLKVEKDEAAGPGQWVIVGLAVALYAATLAFLCLHLGLVMFEERADYGDAELSDPATVTWSIIVTLGAGVVLPWISGVDPRARELSRLPPARHMVAAMSAMVAMLGYMVVIEPAGGRRVGLSIAIPILLLPVAVALAWRFSRSAPPAEQTSTNDDDQLTRRPV